LSAKGAFLKNGASMIGSMYAKDTRQQQNPALHQSRESKFSFQSGDILTNSPIGKHQMN
jgi:hypothetical protein